MKLGTQVESSYTAARKLKGGQKHHELTILYRTVHNAYQSFLISKQTNFTCIYLVYAVVQQM